MGDTTKPAALQLADMLEALGWRSVDKDMKTAAAELRRLHARVAELEAAALRTPVPKGYALVSEEALQAMGVLDDLKKSAAYPTVSLRPPWDGLIKPADFVVDTFRRTGSGWLPSIDICVRVTHVPTGVFEEECSQRSTHANKAIAWQRMQDRLDAHPLAAAPDRQLRTCESQNLNHGEPLGPPAEKPTC